MTPLSDQVFDLSLTTMTDEDDYTGTTTEEFQSREFDAFKEAITNSEPRFTHPYTEMFSTEWASNELIPFLQKVYGNRSRIVAEYGWWWMLERAEWIEPKHMVSNCFYKFCYARSLKGCKPNYPIDDPVFVERLRLALVSSGSAPRPSLVRSVAENVELTVRLLIRRCKCHGGPFRLASLPDSVRPEMAEEVRVADYADRIRTLFCSGREGWKKMAEE